MSGEFGAFGEPDPTDADDPIQHLKGSPPIGHKQWLESLDLAYGEEDEDRSLYWQLRIYLQESFNTG